MEKIGNIRGGVTIDHIRAGNYAAVLRALRITPGAGKPIIIVVNARSKRMGRKDIIKLEGAKIGAAEYKALKRAARGATVNIIRGYKVIAKTKVK